MAGFDAGGIVEPLDFDFTTLDPPVKGLEDVKGTIREPAPLQVQQFIDGIQRELARGRRELRDLGIPEDAGGMGQDEILDALGKADPQRIPAALKRKAELYSQLCSGHPTAGQLLKLPFRVMTAFEKWITDEVLNPEAAAGGGNAQVLPLRPAAGA